MCRREGSLSREGAGFTLLEVCLAVAIGLLLTLIAVPSIRSVLEQERLHRTFEAFDGFVAKAQVRSVNERRTLALVWREEGIEMVGMEKQNGEEAPAETFPVSKEQKFLIERPAALGPKPPAVWTFWRSGVCEPALITYEGPEGTWKARYDALTGRRTILEEQLK
jgi:Tfp pilus assembly major pilin PilA